VIIVAVYRSTNAGKAMGRSAEHAAILLCLAGALMMVIIGDSLARALGIAGGASIIRFRTPIKDPKDALIFLLLLGLGMACGLGNFPVAGLGTFFVSLLLLFLTPETKSKRRRMVLEMVANGADFPSAPVQSILAQHKVDHELREVAKNKDASLIYEVRLHSGTSIDDLTGELMGAGLKSISWQKAK
jgi:hypothetical protein